MSQARSSEKWKYTGGSRSRGLIFRVKTHTKKPAAHMAPRTSTTNIWPKTKRARAEGECGLGDEEEVPVPVTAIRLGLFHPLRTASQFTPPATGWNTTDCSI